MNPAFSVILFTTLSGAGYGLLFAWVSGTFGYSLIENTNANEMARGLAFAAGFALVTIGLLSSMFHLGKPQRAWRAFSQWRTSWLSREGVVSILTYAAIVGFLLATRFGDARMLKIAGASIAICSIATVCCTGMIYASLKTVPAWCVRGVIPIYLLFALLTGGLLYTAILSSAKATPALSTGALVNIASAQLILAVLKWKYWRDIDRIVLPSREAATALEGIGKVTVFERPHTEANYLTREMGFVLARKHSRKLRAIALLLFAGVPLLALALAWLLPIVAVFALWIAALAALAGAFVERWLFFAEAKHMVMLYY